MSSIQLLAKRNDFSRRHNKYYLEREDLDYGEIPEDFEALLNELDLNMVSLDELLKLSDFVTLHCDLNPSSNHLINKQALKKMKKNAVLLNLARGQVVDEKALIRALKKDEFAGAALDVFEQEPLDVNSPLNEMNNVMLAPHNCNSSPRAWEAVHWSTVHQLLSALKAAS